MKRKSKKQNNVVNGFLAKIYSCIRCAEKKRVKKEGGEVDKKKKKKN